MNHVTAIEQLETLCNAGSLHGEGPVVRGRRDDENHHETYIALGASPISEENVMGTSRTPRRSPASAVKAADRPASTSNGAGTTDDKTIYTLGGDLAAGMTNRRRAAAPPRRRRRQDVLPRRRCNKRSKTRGSQERNIGSKVLGGSCLRDRGCVCG